jgi:hypothetical protein
MAQPVPERDVPPLPWARMALIVLVIVIALTAVWERRMRERGFLPGDLGDEAAAWVEQRRRLDTEHPPVAIIGDSRILFDTDLAHFQRLTGVKPVQLALAGTNARPFLEEVADHSRFSGLLLVGIAEASYYRPGIGRGGDALKAARFEPPNQRISFVLSRSLRRRFGFLDESASLSTQVAHLDRNWRPGARGPYGDVWKMAVFRDDRQAELWSRIKTDPFLRAHAIGVWLKIYAMPGPTPEMIVEAEARTKASVAKIRARGGEVIFLRPPSAPQLRAIEDERVPRETVWNRLMHAAGVQGVHADELPAAQDLDLPELSHLSKACAQVYTDAYVRALSAITPRIRLAHDAAPPLTRADCVAHAQN